VNSRRGKTRISRAFLKIPKRETQEERGVRKGFDITHKILYRGGST